MTILNLTPESPRRVSPQKLAKQTAFPCSPVPDAFILEVMAKAIYERENRDALNMPLPWSESSGLERRKAKQRAKAAFRALRTAGYSIAVEGA